MYSTLVFQSNIAVYRFISFHSASDAVSFRRVSYIFMPESQRKSFDVIACHLDMWQYVTNVWPYTAMLRRKSSSQGKEPRQLLLLLSSDLARQPPGFAGSALAVASQDEKLWKRDQNVKRIESVNRLIRLFEDPNSNHSTSSCLFKSVHSQCCLLRPKSGECLEARGKD